jgi:hypothetical protein
MHETAPENPAAGLCETCRYMRTVVSGKGSRFLYCSRAETDDRYAKYPRLPVLCCSAYDSNTKDSLVE